MIPRVLIFNPWERLIGPNRYMVEMLRFNPELAAASTVVLDEENGAMEEYRQLGCEVVVWPETRLIHPHFSMIGLQDLLRTHSIELVRVARKVKSIHPDVVVSNSEILWIGGMVSRVLRIPHLQIFHGILSHYRFRKKPWLWKIYLKFLSLWSQYFIAVSRTLASVMISGGLPVGNVVTIENPISPDGSCLWGGNDKVKYDDITGNRYPILLCAGQIFPVKGQDFLIEAIPEIRRYFPEVLCLFAGRVGSDSGLDDTRGFYDKLVTRIGELHLESNVKFLGEVDRMNAWLRRADVCVQPSRMESFCRVAAEALLCGTPVVAFDVGAIPEVVGLGGLLVPAGDVEGLARGVVNTLSNPEETQRRVEKGRAHIEQCFNATKMSRAFHDLILRVAAGSRLSSYSDNRLGSSVRE